ncbi:uncharacterized protein [Bemisia tabaci]
MIRTEPKSALMHNLWNRFTTCRLLELELLELLAERGMNPVTSAHVRERWRSPTSGVMSSTALRFSRLTAHKVWNKTGPGFWGWLGWGQERMPGGEEGGRCAERTSRRFAEEKPPGKASTLRRSSNSALSSVAVQKALVKGLATCPLGSPARSKMLGATVIVESCICLLIFVSTSNSQEFFSTGGRYGKRIASEESFDTGRPSDTSVLERRSLSITPDNSPLLEVSGRNDRFFMGSRYGKRALDLLKSDFRDVTGARITCVYIGFEDLFRCSNGKDRKFHEVESLQREENK